MALGNPTPPEIPIPPPAGRISRIPPLRAAGPRWNILEGVSRYLRFRMLLRKRSRRSSRPAPALSPDSLDHHDIDKLA